MAQREQSSAIEEFVTVARAIAKLASQRGDVLEQQMGEAADVRIPLAILRPDKLTCCMCRSSTMLQTASRRSWLAFASFGVVCDCLVTVAMQARAEMSETQLVVSEAILGCSMNLMQAIKRLQIDSSWHIN